MNLGPDEEVPRSVTRWGDQQQYHAQPMQVNRDEQGNILPKVTLLWMTPDPLGAIAAMAEMYKGHVVHNLAEITQDIRSQALIDVQKTHLQAPLEAVKLHFMVEGVTRSFTHQMVRQRTAVYAQESLRFSVKDTEPWDDVVSRPPSIASLKEDSPARVVWDDAVRGAERAYRALVDHGIPAEDARGLMPHAMTTRLNYITDLRNLKDHAGNRLCTQAQFEWRIVFLGIVQAIRTYPDVGQPGFGVVRAFDRWQFPELANSGLFRPVCYHLNHCPFQASFDRACTIRERVEMFARHGVKSARWREGALVADAMGLDLELEPINPAEWLLDASAARVGPGGHA